ncbi:MAG: hypothetical protein V8R55_00300 [Dysosmobacter sp.]
MCFHNGNNDCSCLWLIIIVILICCCCGGSAWGSGSCGCGNARNDGCGVCC